MKPLEDIYKASFFGHRHKLHWRAEYFCNAVMSVITPKSVVDVGCATGDLVAEFSRLGVHHSWGIEGSIRAKPFAVTDDILWWDVREDWGARKPGAVEWFDLCLCLEVAEHIEPEYADQFVDNLSYLSDKLMITAAPPGQGGHYHVNCQPYQYWIDKFEAKGYEEKSYIAEMVKQQLFPWRKKPGIKAWYDNMLYFERRPNVS
jgi:hypothetical protein